ncbi:esterase [Bifidobacterium sp. ESL0763]|uniref:alpha/beta hydrolase n=1 Tax=Bifidobacterium sp. ESL0763 TaxID=2983227 RepID=UPI0023F921AB|nr:esterase [Bifidobacterium sp. ESL0763]MDF7663078.1 esterase [Bifidobacterium sp. ESL0763]
MSEVANETKNDDGDGLVGRQSPEIPGRFGEPMSVGHVQYSQGGGKTRPSRPMFLCLHGWGSNETDLADMMRFVAPYNDFASLRAPLVLQEEGPGEFGSGSGAFSWFHQGVPAGDDRDRDLFAAATAVDQWVSAHIESGRDVVPIGFSQGAALAIHLLRINPKRYRAVIALSGFVAQARVAGTAPADDELASLETPVFYGYGDRDSVLPKYELNAACAWLEEHTWLTAKDYHTLDHAVSLEEFTDVRQWLVLNNISSGIE